MCARKLLACKQCKKLFVTESSSVCVIVDLDSSISTAQHKKICENVQRRYKQDDSVLCWKEAIEKKRTVNQEFYLSMYMQYLPLGSLDDLLQKSTLLGMAIPPEHVAYIAKELLSIFSRLHADKVFHLNLKPENILIGDDGALKWTDCLVEGTKFGCCDRLVQHRFFLSPERISGDSFNKEKDDIWALGLILYTCMFGEHPIKFNQEDSSFVLLDRTVKFDFKKPEEFDERMNEKFSDLLSKMLCNDANERETARTLCEHEWLQTASSREEFLAWAQEIHAAIPEIGIDLSRRLSRQREEMAERCWQLSRGLVERKEVDMSLSFLLTLSKKAREKKTRLESEITSLKKERDSQVITPSDVAEEKQPLECNEKTQSVYGAMMVLATSGDFEGSVDAALSLTKAGDVDALVVLANHYESIGRPHLQMQVLASIPESSSHYKESLDVRYNYYLQADFHEMRGLMTPEEIEKRRHDKLCELYSLIHPERQEKVSLWVQYDQAVVQSVKSDEQEEARIEKLFCLAFKLGLPEAVNHYAVLCGIVSGKPLVEEMNLDPETILAVAGAIGEQLRPLEEEHDQLQKERQESEQDRVYSPNFFQEAQEAHGAPAPEGWFGIVRSWFGQ